MDNKVQMTKNEYQNYLEKIANRLHTDKDYSLDDYRRDADSVQVLDFDLERFNLSSVDREIINHMFFTESVDRLGNFSLRGHVLGRNVVNLIANTIECKNKCDKGHSGFYINNDKNVFWSFAKVILL